MFIFTKLNEVVTMQDNGTVVNLIFFKNSNKHKSFCGGIFSIVLLVCSVGFGGFKGLQMIKK